MTHSRPRAWILVIYIFVFSAGWVAIDSVHADDALDTDPFYRSVMLAPPPVPARIDTLSLECEVRVLEQTQKKRYRTASEIGYQNIGWERRLAADWHALPSGQSNTQALIIDFAKQSPNGPIAYRYLASDASQDTLYEPWSSSKVMAISAAMATLRTHGLDGRSSIGGHRMEDIITSIHSYKPSGDVNGDSNALASYLVNLSGRQRLYQLFHNEWLLIANASVRLSGAYNAEPFKPASSVWLSSDNSTRKKIGAFAASDSDPFYEAYLCDRCGKLGNKPMSTLAQAEWLKRLAVHSREPLTRHPGLLNDDVEALFFAAGGDEKQKLGGMMAGLSRMLARALASSMEGRKPSDSKRVLDKHTAGKWRIYQKIGWGYSETRAAGEVVLLAHVCLPDFQRGREFTLVARSSVSGGEEILVSHAGVTLEQTILAAVSELFTK